MATFWQLTRINRKPVVRLTRRTALEKSPQRTAILIKNIKEVTPRKPNSAKRKVAWTEIRKKQMFVLFYFKKHVYLPGNGTLLKKLRVGGYDKIYQNLSAKNAVLIRGGRAKDVPGIQYKMVFTNEDPEKKKKKKKKYALMPIVIYNQKRSKYGVKFKIEDREKCGTKMPYYYAANQVAAMEKRNKKIEKRNKAKEKRNKKREEGYEILEELEKTDVKKQRCFERNFYNRRKVWKNFDYQKFFGY